MELIGQRDSYQRLAKTWRLLLSEAQRIEHFCTDLAQSLEHAITLMSTGQAHEMRNEMTASKQKNERHVPSS